MWIHTNIELNILNCECGRRYNEAKALLVFDKDGGVKAALVQIIHGELVPSRLQHDLVSAAERPRFELTKKHCRPSLHCLSLSIKKYLMV